MGAGSRTRDGKAALFCSSKWIGRCFNSGKQVTGPAAGEVRPSPFVLVSPALVGALHQCQGGKRQVSAGLLAVGAAFSLCERVRLYGFGNATEASRPSAAAARSCGHYWDSASCRSQADYMAGKQGYHDWWGQWQLLERWARDGEIAIRGARSSGVAGGSARAVEPPTLQAQQPQQPSRPRPTTTAGGLPSAAATTGPRAAAAAGCPGERPRSPQPPPGGWPPLHARLPVGCASPRNVYADLGASWCNTLLLYQLVPSLDSMALPSKWQVYAFEPAPLIVPHVERCCRDLSRGLPLPPAPVPPTGSSHQLLSSEVRARLNCSHAAGHKQMVSCTAAALSKALAALRPDAALSQNRSLIQSRMGALRTQGCDAASAAPAAASSPAAAASAAFTLVPAASSVADGELRMAGGALQMLRGGALPRSRGGGAETFRVEKVDVVGWLLSTVGVDDFVILKMDVEGEEEAIVPALLATNASRLVDVLLWERHAKWRGTGGICQCAAWEKALRASGVRAIYRDPYPFVSKRVTAPWELAGGR